VIGDGFYRSGDADDGFAANAALRGCHDRTEPFRGK
jgi:hypothetical protein